MLNTFKVCVGGIGLTKQIYLYKKIGLLFLQKPTQKCVLFYFVKTRLKVFGKVFRWSFFCKKLALRLNHSHPNTLFFNGKGFLKLVVGKYDNTILFLKPLKSVRLFFFINKTRKINVFTKRGLYIENPYNKKLGKISSYL